MTDLSTDRPPYGAALAVSLVVLAGYLLTLAPTVTFWDAGEFIAAARTLGIPHPPGTPLFVMIAHVWGTLLPVGEFAWRTNLLSATLSAGAAGFFFLVIHASIGRTGGVPNPRTDGGRTIRLLGAAAAALCGAFVVTNWQNSNETEVYAVATCTIAAVCWLALRWRARRGTARATQLLLAAVYLGGVSVGNHLLALLVGPALVGFLAHTVATEPAATAEERRREWAEVAVVAGVWALLIGSGLGNTALLTLGALCFAGAALFALTAGAFAFAALALVVAAIGVTPYAFLYLRAGQAPILNEADPSTWESLLAVIQRAQYPVRTPFDDPTELHGPDNPGRSLAIIGLQLLNYLQYFDWQYARALPDRLAAVPVRAFATLLFFSLGVAGSAAQRRSDRGAWWLTALLFLTTGLGLVAYMNFKPGFSIGYDLFPEGRDHEVRERDYFFVVSFVVWGLWAGLGAATWARRLLGRPQAMRALAWSPLALALVPMAGNWSVAGRRHGADATLPADFAYNVLNTVPPYGILFTYGDNDTFPLWWAQEVEGIRQDVTVVCLALAQTEWYMRQLRDNPLRPFDEARAPAIWRGLNPAPPTWPVHSMTDAEILQAASQPVYLSQPVAIQLGPIQHTLPAETVLMPNDLVSLRIIQQNLGRRPLVWALTAAGRDFYGLRGNVVQEGLGFRLYPQPADTARPEIEPRGPTGGAFDIATTERLAWETYRYGHLFERPTEHLETTAASISASLSVPFTQLAFIHEQRGDTTKVLDNLERAERLSPSPQLRAAIDQMRALRRLEGKP